MTSGAAIEIGRIGAQGDGVAEGDAGARFIPFALPGEAWTQCADGSFERLSDAAERQVPECPHFGACGGCVAQHMSAALYADWKSNQVQQALAHQGIDIDLKAMWQAPKASRRRIVLSASVMSSDVRIGFRAAGSHDLVEINTCIIADPKIVEALPVLRLLLALIAGDESLPDDMRIHVLLADNGVDVLIDGVNTDLPAAMRERLAGVAQDFGILRLRIGHTEIFQVAPPILQVGGAQLRVPAGVFVQAVAAAESVMAAMAVKALGRSKHVADLFCGLGTFALPLAKRARVLAVDNQPDAVAALDDAVRHAQGLKPIESLRRDLFREPLSRNELNAFDGVVLDPPRAGAAAQSAALAKSKVPVVVAVSCNPATLARDLRTLIDGGYKLQSVTPIDQFLYSAHVEAVAVLKR
jgi:23S rRNA (uracil1939-C5)-methyltransferase